MSFGREQMVQRVAAAAEVMGGRRPSEAALGVIAERASRDHDVGIAALRWLSENDSGTLTLAKLMKAMVDIGAQAKRKGSADGGCVANGCPLPGTITTGGAWRCRYHLDTPDHGPQADAVTHVLRTHSAELEMSARLCNEPGRPAWEAFSQIESMLVAECRRADTEVIERARKQAEGNAGIEEARKSLVAKANEMLRQSRLMKGVRT